MDAATSKFSHYEKKEYRSERLRTNLTGARVLFSRKLDIMNEEFDTYIGALLADLIFKNAVVRSQIKSNLERIDYYDKTELSKQLIEDLAMTEHQVYVDTAQGLSDDEDDEDKPLRVTDQQKVFRRSTQIAEKAYLFL